METSPDIETLFVRDFKNSYIAHIFKEIYLDRVYAPFLEGKKDLIIADWGGNQGYTSYYFKDYAKQVFCVEPSKIHLEVINKMIEANKFTNIKVCPYAISNTNGKEKFYHNPNVTMFSLEATVNNPNDYEEVETVTPLEFMKREGIESIDLLKADLEGSESQVFASEEFRAIADVTKVICGEWHAWTAMSQPQFKQCLEDWGYEFKWLEGTDASCFTAIKR